MSRLREGHRGDLTLSCGPAFGAAQRSLIQVTRIGVAVNKGCYLIAGESSAGDKRFGDCVSIAPQHLLPRLFVKVGPGKQG